MGIRRFMPNKHRTVTLFLIERQELSRTGFRLIFEMDEGIEIVGEGDEIESSVETICQLQPRVVLLRADAVEPDVDHIRNLRAQAPDTDILVLTDIIEANAISKFIAAGANGCCSRNVNVENLLVAVRSVAAGGMWFGPTAANVVRAVLRGELSLASQFVRSHDQTSIPASLTDRESEILKRVAQGLTNQQIAERLHLSVETVKTYIRRIMDKSSIRNRRELVARFHRSGSYNV
jgi:DNA-binding NarL/FixJ family response regulator